MHSDSEKRCHLLGDTYYSGEDDEIRDRLIGNWPKRPTAR
jgi:hypothetical protein